MPTLLVAMVAGAAEPPGYYNAVDMTDATAMRATLHAVIDDHTRVPYSSSSLDTWDVLELGDEDPGDAANILDVYKNLSIPKFGGGTGPYNREHTWPNSYGFNDATSSYPYTDCHALFLSDPGYNSSRGNEPYGTCSDPACVEKTVAGGTSGVYPGLSNWRIAGTWETWLGRRGDVARAQLYMDVRYAGGTHGVTGAAEPDLILTDDVALIATTASGSVAATAYHGRLTVLLHWSDQDPVDEKERRHHEAAYVAQGNRNPFIDHPEWIDCVFLGACGLRSDGFERGDLLLWTYRYPPF